MRLSLAMLLILVPVSLFSQHALELDTSRFTHDAGDGSGTAFSVNIGPDFGTMFGLLQEWVFIDRSGGNAYNDVLSRLDWQLNPLFYFGISGSLTHLPRFFIGFGGWIGIPGLPGAMEDRDWDAVTGAYTTYSHVENSLLNALFFDVNAGYGFVASPHIALNVLVGFNFKQFHMSGHDGWQEFPPGTFDQYLIGNQIDYEVNFFLPYIGCETKWSPAEWFSADLFLSVSPWLAFVYARDAHLNPSKIGYYQDLPQFGFYFSGIVTLSFRFGDRFEIRVKNSLMWTPQIKGPTFAGGDLVAGARGGASLILYSPSASLIFALSP